MNKLSLSLVLLLCAIASFAQHGNFSDIRLINGDSILSGSSNGTIFYNRVSNKFRFRQNGSWISIGSGSGSVSSVSGTTNRITSTGGTTPVIDISASYAGQNSITNTGTLTSGATGVGFTLSFTNSTLSGRIAESNIPAKYVYTKATPSTAGGTITLDMNSAMFAKFVGSASFSTAKILALSNTTNAESFNFFFTVTNVAAVLTAPSDWQMVDSRWDGTTWTASQTGSYELGGDWTGTYWSIKISGPSTP